MNGLIGAVLVFGSCAVMGMYASASYRRAVRELEAFLCLIVHIRGQIDGFLMPLHSILAEYTDPLLEKNGFLPESRENGACRALEKVRNKLYMDDRCITELENFFMGLGLHSAEEEARHCSYYEKRIGELTKNARDALPSKGRMCRAFGALAGIMLAVILL